MIRMPGPKAPARWPINALLRRPLHGRKRPPSVGEARTALGVSSNATASLWMSTGLPPADKLATIVREWGLGKAEVDRAWLESVAASQGIKLGNLPQSPESTWLFHAADCPVRIARGAISFEVKASADGVSGDLSIVRAYDGISAPAPVSELHFRELARDGNGTGHSPALNLIREPPGVTCSTSTATANGWHEHTVRFDPQWSGGEDVGLETSVIIPRAFPAHERQQPLQDQRPAVTVPPRGSVPYHVRHAFERLELTYRFLDTFTMADVEPICWHGDAPASDQNLPIRACRHEVIVDPGGASATLELERPVPGYSFGLSWTPKPVKEKRSAETDDPGDDEPTELYNRGRSL